VRGHAAKPKTEEHDFSSEGLPTTRELLSSLPIVDRLHVAARSIEQAVKALQTGKPGVDARAHLAHAYLATRHASKALGECVRTLRGGSMAPLRGGSMAPFGGAENLHVATSGGAESPDVAACGGAENLHVAAPSGYYPTFFLHEELEAGDAQWLTECQGDGPLALSDVTDVCATYGVRAELRNEAGFLVGRVDAKGDYSLP
jgi:hypothetical protein